jgi:glycerol-3-phosphate dehydrogenase
VFKILGDGAFAKAVTHMITTRGGTCSNTGYKWVIPCIPSYGFDSISIESDKKYIFVSKGLVENGMLVTEWGRAHGLTHAFLGGPHLASEILAGLNTTSTIACSEGDFQELSHYFPNPTFCPHLDFIALSGIIKNIIGYACGLFVRRKAGENFKASIITQGARELIEIARFLSIPFDLVDLLQPAVLSDMILTGTSHHSRNFMAGFDQVTTQNEERVIESMHSVQLLVKRIGLSDKWPVISMVTQVINGRDISVEELPLNGQVIKKYKY